jgi:hypothetical protein
MPVIQFVVLILTAGMTVITLVILVSVMLGVAWLAVAVPVLLVIGLVAAGRALWHRWRHSPDASKE